ncbi:hypothetical protein V0242_18580 [Aeromonas hydrophila]|jgi:IS30 family transposase|uniref:hypothetical protein n=1 Tax=Aeromonas hydrophila TaxID=644 RepID=UPI002ED4C917|nr:hypothetical protein V0242_18580 [Aeromonas hydrophila]
MLEQKKKRGPKPAFDVATAQEMERLNKQGYTMESIAKQYNTTQGTVSRSIQRLKSER